MHPTTILSAAAALGALLVASPAAQAGVTGYTFTEIAVPGSTGTIGGGINDRGQIVGEFTDDAGIQHGFLDTGGHLTNINPPGDTFTMLFGINNVGQILGTTSSIANFVYAHGKFTPLSNLGESAFAFGINDLGQIVGGLADSNGDTIGLLDTRGRITTYAVPGASVTAGYGINDFGEIVGNYLDRTGFHPFLDRRGVLTNLEVPGDFALASGINNLGQITGQFCDNAGCHGFLDTRGSFTTIDVPGASFTDAQGINDLGQIVGYFGDSTGLFSAFVATPIHGFAMSSALAMSAIDPPADAVPEPSTWVMLLLGFTGLGFAGYRTTRRSLSTAT
jgi:probable HAF family extracellular repeat protein